MLEASLLQVFALLLGVIALFAATLFGLEIQRVRAEAQRLMRELEKKGERVKAAESGRDALLSATLLDMPGQVAAIEGYAKRLLEGEAGNLPLKAVPSVEKIARAARRLAESLAETSSRR